MFNFCPNCGTKGSVQKLDATNYECGTCKWHFWNNPKAAVAIAFVKDGKLLYSKRGRASDPAFGMYDLPGGFVDFGETAEAAAIREVFEETSVHIAEKDLQLLAVYHADYNEITSTIDIVFLVRTWQGEFKPQDDSDALEWKPLDFIKDEQFSEIFYIGLDRLIADEIAKTT